MQPKDFKIIYFEKGDFVDEHQNVWCNILFEGHQNEPIRIVVKDPNAYSVGQTVYGHIEQKTSKAGKPYLRFYRDQKDQQQSGYTREGYQGGSKPQASSPGQSTDESIARAVALKAAVEYGKDVKRDEILYIANEFLAWLQGKESESSPTRYVVAPATNDQLTNGYAKFQASRPKIDEDAEAQSLYARAAEAEQTEQTEPPFFENML